MMGCRSRKLEGLLRVVAALAVLLPAVAWAKKKQSAPVQLKDNAASEDLASYIAHVRSMYPGVTSSGSTWSATGRFTALSRDVKASNPHDLISIIVSENLAASTVGTVKNARASNNSSALSALFGAFSTSSAAQNALSQTSTSGLNAQGQSVTNSSLNTTIGGEVVDVLPNGILVIEVARNLEFNQQTETILVRGLVRPEDVSPQNQVLSTAISGLQVEVVGKGIVNDYTYRPNALVRLLQRVLIP